MTSLVDLAVISAVFSIWASNVASMYTDLLTFSSFVFWSLNSSLILLVFFDFILNTFW